MSDKSWWNMERYMKTKAGEIPDDMLLLAFNPMGFDPSIAPEGKQVLLTGTLCPPNPKMKDMKKYLDAFEERLFKFYPALKGHVVRCEDYTTADVSRLTRDSAVPGCGGECIGLAQIVGPHQYRAPCSMSALTRRR